MKKVCVVPALQPTNPWIGELVGQGVRVGKIPMNGIIYHIPQYPYYIVKHDNGILYDIPVEECELLDDDIEGEQLITYKKIKSGIVVYIDGVPSGQIKKEKGGYVYAANVGLRGWIYTTLKEIKTSLESGSNKTAIINMLAKETKKACKGFVGEPITPEFKRRIGVAISSIMNSFAPGCETVKVEADPLNKDVVVCTLTIPRVHLTYVKDNGAV